MLKRKYLTNTTFYVGVNVTKHFFIPTFYKCLNVCLYVPKKSGNLLSTIKKKCVINTIIVTSKIILIE